MINYKFTNLTKDPLIDVRSLVIRSKNRRPSPLPKGSLRGMWLMRSCRTLSSRDIWMLLEDLGSGSLL